MVVDFLNKQHYINVHTTQSPTMVVDFLNKQHYIHVHTTKSRTMVVDLLNKQPYIHVHKDNLHFRITTIAYYHPIQLNQSEHNT